MSKFVWTDAVCINQKNLDELGKQVLLMKDIFSKATLTLVWLGEPDSPELIPPMFDLGYKIIDMTKTVTPRRLTSEDFEECGLPPIEDPAWTTLANFLCLPYFQRVWIMQEYILAQHVEFLYGIHCESHDYIVEICETLVSNDDSYYLEATLRPLVSRVRPTLDIFYSNADPDRWWGISQKLCRLESLRKLRAQNDAHQLRVLRMLLRRSQSSRTTNLRDYVFGMLGILPEDTAKHEDLQPDYKTSHQVAYTKLARYVLKEHGLATLLTSTGFPRSAIRKPSWVPDWSQQKLVSVVHRKACQTYPSKYGNDTAPWRLDKNEVPEKLFVRGHLFGQIAKVDSLLARARIAPEAPYAEQLQQFIWTTQSMMAETAYMDGDPAALALRHLSALCQADFAGPADGDGHLRISELDSISKTVAPLYDFNNLQPLLDNAEMQQHIATCLGRLHVTDTSMGFCVTSNGEIGRIPHEAEVNDIICFFEGIDIPFVIQQSADSPGEYILIDHCYVDGQMDGKYWEAHKTTETEEICLV